jgi:hypothetical protein
MELEIVCARPSPCQFRVHERYFLEKKRFSPTGCPGCGGALKVVGRGTDAEIAGATLNMTMGDNNQGRILHTAG